MAEGVGEERLWCFVLWSGFSLAGGCSQKRPRGNFRPQAKKFPKKLIQPMEHWSELFFCAFASYSWVLPANGQGLTAGRWR
ncbi:hypothetical protein HDV62DRAFT_116941 [Trichoderma sp. SZMC 28011]